ncbi:hypothetical protein AAFF_G00163120 [Aldrovandia affinis]|uniref:Uncharacterized protein n=1 Tax=Aldrovandia affinis TaxID=143900 RepID=A0AAD7SZ71_9TELE|nr:hypothetical protein AAFF_G00163120 [Aldrovandia affinis]
MPQQDLNETLFPLSHSKGITVALLSSAAPRPVCRSEPRDVRRGAARFGRGNGWGALQLQSLATRPWIGTGLGGVGGRCGGLGSQRCWGHEGWDTLWTRHSCSGSSGNVARERRSSG